MKSSRHVPTQPKEVAKIDWTQCTPVKDRVNKGKMYADYLKDYKDQLKKTEKQRKERLNKAAKLLIEIRERQKKDGIKLIVSSY